MKSGAVNPIWQDNAGALASQEQLEKILLVSYSPKALGFF